VATCFGQLDDDPEATHEHNTKITFANFILGRNDILVC